VKNPFISLSSIGLAIGLTSCALPQKALIIAEGPKQQAKREQQAATTQVPAPSRGEDGLRMPDMLALPDDSQLRSAAPETTGDAAVIVRPPAE